MEILKRELKRDRTICTFHMQIKRDPAQSRAEGRDIHVEVPYARIQHVGDRNSIYDQPAHDKFQFVADPHEGSRWLSAVDMFPDEWRAFMAGQHSDPVSGTRIEEFPGISRARAEDLKSLGIRTVENLAALSDAVVSKLGMDGGRLREKARNYIDAASASAEVDRAADRIAALERRIEQLTSAKGSAPSRGEPRRAIAADQLAEMDADGLRAYLTDHGVDFDRRLGTEKLRVLAVDWAADNMAAQ